MSAAWILIVDTDLDDYLVGVQVDALRSLLLQAGQVNPFTTMMHDTASRIRAKIQSCDSNVVSATAHSIPPECKWIACYLILDQMQGRFPTLPLTDHQRDQIKEAIRQLDRIADCKDVVTEPIDPLPTDVQRGGSVEVIDTSIETSRRRVTSTTMQGL